MYDSVEGSLRGPTYPIMGSMGLSDALSIRGRKLVRHPAWYRGSGVVCPCCGGRFRRLVKYGGRRNARCPRCWSAERHRVLWLFLERETDVLSAPLTVLHFAPESAIAARLAAQPNLDYTSADLDPRAAMESMDITDIPRADATIDVVLVSHVLEHIPDDRKALRELHRILRPGGKAILQHPIDYDRDETYEDWTITTPEGRRRAFMQEDHVRIYGRDFGERLAGAGFEVRMRRYQDELAVNERRTYCLQQGTPTQRSDDIYACVKLASDATSAGGRP